MSDDLETKSNSFAAQVPPAKKDEETEEINDSVKIAQNTILAGLSSEMANVTLENIKTLAPLDDFEIAGIKYTRKKITPKLLREIRKAEQKYNEDIAKMEDSENRVDRDFQLLYIKANAYLGMTEEQFEETDVEHLTQVIQATEFRTQGFRKRQ